MEKYLTVTEVAERLQVHWQSVSPIKKWRIRGSKTWSWISNKRTSY
jgi:hypothetical protein